ncbi:hypothetical protein JOC70_001311 [Clostridium pascui]|nr:hypothetical protein [Clostridium pascui]
MSVLSFIFLTGIYSRISLLSVDVVRSVFTQIMVFSPTTRLLAPLKIMVLPLSVTPHEL